MRLGRLTARLPVSSGKLIFGKNVVPAVVTAMFCHQGRSINLHGTQGTPHVKGKEGVIFTRFGRFSWLGVIESQSLIRKVGPSRDP